MTSKMLIVATAGGALAGALAVSAFHMMSSPSENSGTQKDAPLYWVAPMDDSYRRDKPGKSPMGMDLVPVYSSDDTDNTEPAGTVKISPMVENNLGVKTATARTGYIDSEITTVGYVKYDEDEIVHIHPRVEGWIEQQYVNATGDPVDNNQPLYALYSPELVNAQEEYIIALNRDNASLIQAATERLAALDVPDSVIEQVAKTRKVVRTITFNAPQSGFVDTLNIRDGFYVQPGMTLMSIGQLDTVWVEAEVFERDATRVTAGMPVTMTVNAISGKTWQGTIDYVAPALQSNSRTLPVRLEFNNPDHRLKPNMLARINIDVQSARTAVLVPTNAVIRTGRQNRVVLALGDGKYRSVTVDTGRAGKNDIEILSGLNAGDRIVTSAQFLIDSESAKSADFSRMSTVQTNDAVWAKGHINAINIAERKVSIDHESVEALDWPAMTMDFSVADNVAMDKLAAGQTLHFQISKQNRSFFISKIHVIAAKPKTSPAESSGHAPTNDTTTTSASVNTTGVVVAVSPQQRQLTIHHEAIDAWDWPAMTMRFSVDDTITMDKLTIGQSLHVKLLRNNKDEVTITGIHIMPASNDARDDALHRTHQSH